MGKCCVNIWVYLYVTKLKSNKCNYETIIIKKYELEKEEGEKSKINAEYQ